VREFAAELFYQHPGRLLEVAGAAVVTEPLPEFHQPFVVDFCQRFQRRELGHEALVIGADRLDAGLLEHDLRDPDAIGRRVVAPRQNPFVRIVPGQQRGNDFAGEFHRNSMRSSRTLAATSGDRVISVTIAIRRAPALTSSGMWCALMPPITVNGSSISAATFRISSTPSGS